MKNVTLTRVFVGATVVVVAIVGLSFWLFLRASRRSILETANHRRVAEAHRVESKVTDALDHAQRAIDTLDRGFREGTIIDDSPERSVRLDLFNVLADETLAEATFTHAKMTGYDAKGDAELSPKDHYQISVYRTADGQLRQRSTSANAEGLFQSEDGPFEPGTTRDHPVQNAREPATDPTMHPTFTVLARKDLKGHSFWSDLHPTELDQQLPAEKHRVVLTLQKATFDHRGQFAGVLRIGLSTAQIDAISNLHADDTSTDDPYWVTLLAASPSGVPRPAQLVARVSPKDQLQLFGDDLRFVTHDAPPPIAALLASPLLLGLDMEHPNAEGSVLVNGERYLATLRELTLGRGGTAGWTVAILVPESRYTGELEHFQRMFLIGSAITLSLLALISGLLLGALKRGLTDLGKATARMKDFDFAPGHQASPVRDIDEVLEGMERAKTVARAMGKYVPIELVRGLYQANQEPTLGGAAQDLTLMFTDIEGFTTLSEKLSPDDLARRLGDYLETMTVAIEGTGGTIDKYIGDAVMAMWNAPLPIEDHAVRACRAVLACRKALAELYASPKWASLPALVTRFGVHTTRALVGNFGAPTRLSYTALGDGVNLAARLEPLCKQYGVITLVSEDIVKRAGDELVFRRMDRVAVKGKTTGIEVFELLGAKGEIIAEQTLAIAYESALESYFAQRFDQAIEILDAQKDADPPSRVLLARCRDLKDAPPPPSWDGVHVAKSK